MERQILHVDVNNAFLSWTAAEMLKDGSSLDIRTIPCIIGGDEERRSGIVIAKSMPAKKYGVVTAETIYSAKKKCPTLRVYKGLPYSKYREYSNSLYNLFLEYTDKIERFSIDECFLDLTEYLQGRTLLDIAKEINKRVREELGFTVNVGVAHNKLLAKMASDFTKPDRVHTLFESEIPTKMWTLPLSDLFGLGKKTVPKLYNMRIKTIGDLARADRKLLTKKFGKHGDMMWRYANGIDDSRVKYIPEPPKSIGNSVTLPRNASDITELEQILFSLTEQVTFRLRKINMLANVVNVQLRTDKFEDSSHQSKLNVATSNTKDIYTKAKELLHELYHKGTLIRLVGVSVSNLVKQDEVQLSIFADLGNEKQDKIDKTVDELKNKFGYNKITRASNMTSQKIVKITSKDE